MQPSKRRGKEIFISDLEIEANKKYEYTSDYYFGPSFTDAIHRALEIPPGERFGEILKNHIYLPHRKGYLLLFK